ncbi:translation initiation factor IF-2-like [Bubalus kerabau]|uniref:translation initiation factor IF-2-like n=1 Tax=Bubalus carabanensis TaxID=3119969 RepID=UPI00244E787F|nr:translation initiation factor IF-2-like [Bubalus carabanensis]
MDSRVELHPEAVSHSHLQVNPLGTGRPALSPLISHQSRSENQQETYRQGLRPAAPGLRPGDSSGPEQGEPARAKRRPPSPGPAGPSSPFSLTSRAKPSPRATRRAPKGDRKGGNHWRRPPAASAARLWPRTNGTQSLRPPPAAGGPRSPGQHGRQMRQTLGRTTPYLGEPRRGARELSGRSGSSEIHKTVLPENTGLLSYRVQEQVWGKRCCGVYCVSESLCSS